MEEPGKYIRFDWAIKRLLRQKSNFGILEGFLSVLLNKKIKISKLLESEGNKKEATSKTNRVDILAEDDQNELILIEVQVANESSYFHRMLFGVSKLITDYIQQGDNYSKVRKVFSINIVYFPLGVGGDYAYYGRTEFRGLTDASILQLSQRQKELFKSELPSDIFPEYYILKVNDFNKYAKTPLEEWIKFLGKGEISSETKTPGLQQARKQLAVDMLDKDAKAAYYSHLDEMVITEDQILTSRAEGHAEGRAEGLEEGRAEGLEEGRAEGLEEGRAEEKKKIARAMKEKNMPVDTITQITGLSAEEIDTL